MFSQLKTKTKMANYLLYEQLKTALDNMKSEISTRNLNITRNIDKKLAIQLQQFDEKLKKVESYMNEL